MRLLISFCLVFCCLLLLSAGVWPQQSRPNTAVQEQVQEQVLVRVDTDLVTLDVTVTDQQGNYMLDLQAHDFELVEDGTARPIEFFQSMRTLQQSPLALVLALDLSGSISADETTVERQS